MEIYTCIVFFIYDYLCGKSEISLLTPRRSNHSKRNKS